VDRAADGGCAPSRLLSASIITRAVRAKWEDIGQTRAAAGAARHGLEILISIDK
jgi:hypothetical protein